MLLLDTFCLSASADCFDNLNVVPLLRYTVSTILVYKFSTGCMVGYLVFDSKQQTRDNTLIIGRGDDVGDLLEAVHPCDSALLNLINV